MSILFFLKSVFNFALTYWKQIASALILAAFTYFIYDYSRLNGELEVSTQKLSQQIEKNATQQAELDKYYVMSKEQQQNLDNALEYRKKIVEKLSNDIAILKAKKPPVECKTAIDWAIENKDDLSWPK